MEEIKTIYTKLCIEISTGEVVNKYRGSQEITNRHPDIFKWVEWNKELPADFDTPKINADGTVKTKKVKIDKEAVEKEIYEIVYNKYKLKNGKLVKQ